MWALRFRVRQYLKGSLSFYPILGAVIGPLLAVLTRHLDATIGVPKQWQYSPSTASTVLTTIVGATVGLAGFVVTVSVLAIQMATGTFSARYMRIWYRDPLLKATLTMLVATLVFSFALLSEVGTSQAPDIGVSVSGFLIAMSVVLFLMFFEHFTHQLRPVAVAGLVARQGARVATRVTEQAELEGDARTVVDASRVVTVTSGRSGAIQAVSLGGLVKWASRHDRVITMHGAVGDFVIAGQPLFSVSGRGSAPAGASRRLRGMVALGVERTIEQDVAFAIRIIVDIAIKALSAAINDPTTAVQAIDHLEPVLRRLGSTELQRELAFRDARGVPRLQLCGRTWDDFLALGVTEIREYGCNSIQVVRRLRAMLADLQQAVLPAHRAAVEAEIARLNGSVAAGFSASVDGDLAGESDRQGIGGPEAAVSGHAGARLEPQL